MLTAQPTPPAGGAALDEVLIALALALAVAVPVGWFIWRELAGKPTVIGKLADWLAEKEGMPRWVSLPAYGLIAALLTAGFGVWWDVPIHMQNGRDEGPLANPSHYPIYFAILSFFALGVISATLAYRSELPRRSFKILRTWRAPLGSMVLIAAGAIAVAGFPADDLWHRLFGQDVTEWGPTHVMMIGGAVTAPLALPLLQAEAAQLGYRRAGLSGRLRDTIMIALCIVPFAFLMEFDLGVPQFPAATQFIIAGFLTGWMFVATRRYFGPGGALIAWAVYILAHAFLYLTILPLPGVLEAKFLLFLPAAVLVELTALVVKPKRGTAFGLFAGFLAGSLGMLAEWGWSHLFMPLPQPLAASAVPLMIAVGTVAGIGGGLLGVWHYEQLERIGGKPEAADLDEPLRKVRLGALADLVSGFWRRQMADRTGDAPGDGGFWRRHGRGVAGITTFVVLMFVFAPPGEVDGMRGTVALDNDCDGAEFGCMSRVTITMDSQAFSEDPIWLYGLAWQGKRSHPGGDAPGEGVLSTEMVPTGEPGQFRSADPLPMYGTWKTGIRVHQAPTDMMIAVLYAPQDPAIESARGRQVVAESGETITFQYEPEWLQRERKDDVPAWLWTAAYAAVGVAWFALIAFYGWCYARAAGTGPRQARTSPPRRRVPAS